MSDFSKILRDLRKEHNLTQQQLADRLGITKSAVSMYENGHREPNFTIAEALERAFDIDLSKLKGKTFSAQSIGILDSTIRLMGALGWQLTGDPSEGYLFLEHEGYRYELEPDTLKRIQRNLLTYLVVDIPNNVENCKRYKI